MTASSRRVRGVGFRDRVRGRRNPGSRRLCARSCGLFSAMPAVKMMASAPFISTRNWPMYLRIAPDENLEGDPWRFRCPLAGGVDDVAHVAGGQAGHPFKPDCVVSAFSTASMPEAEIARQINQREHSRNRRRDYSAAGRSAGSCPSSSRSLFRCSTAAIEELPPRWQEMSRSWSVPRSSAHRCVT